MNEIRDLADDGTVFRNGRTVGSFLAGTKTDGEVVEMMIGREYKHIFPAKPARATPLAPALAVNGLGWEGRLAEIDLSGGKGEIVGLGGLDGEGPREVLLALFCVLAGVKGRLEVDGRGVAAPNTKTAKTDQIRYPGI